MTFLVLLNAFLALNKHKSLKLCLETVNLTRFRRYKRKILFFRDLDFDIKNFRYELLNTKILKWLFISIQVKHEFTYSSFIAKKILVRYYS